MDLSSKWLKNRDWSTYFLGKAHDLALKIFCCGETGMEEVEQYSNTLPPTFIKNLFKLKMRGRALFSGSKI
jgi:hypothetical protein